MPQAWGVPDQLTPLDATFLELEEADPSAHMHIGALMLFEASAHGVPSLEAVRRHLDERLDTLPRYRQRLSEPQTGGLHWPSWVPYERFDIADHVRHAALPAPGGPTELCEWAAEYWSQRLDRALPLWEVVLVDGLEGGGWALCTKTHHCLVDGVGSVDAAHLLLDATPDERHEHRVPSPGGGTAAREDGGHLVPAPAVARAAAHVVRDAVSLAAHPRETLARSRAVAELIVRDELVAAPRTSLGVPIGTRRRYATVSARLDDIKQIKDALGGTVNDVVLAAVAGGLRCLLEARGEPLPGEGLRAMVPVNVRRPGEELGNHISSLFVSLPVAEADPLRRHAAARSAAESLKSGTQMEGGRTLVDLAGLAPPVLHSVLARSLFASRLFNITVTNVPGPQLPLYAFGARMTEVLPLVPLAAEHAVGVAVVSYDGALTFGINADYEAVPDLAVMANGVADSLADLRTLAAGSTVTLGR
jgi:WS/DGAT/MGAT family acyltransferase